MLHGALCLAEELADWKGDVSVRVMMHERGTPERVKTLIWVLKFLSQPSPVTLVLGSSLQYSPMPKLCSGQLVAQLHRPSLDHVSGLI